MIEICGTNNVRYMFGNNAGCNSITVFQPDVLYPIGWNEWELLFTSTKKELVKEKT